MSLPPRRISYIGVSGADIVTGIAEGVYWIRNKNYGTVLGVGQTNSIRVPLVGQDKYPSRGFRDCSQMWLIEMLSDGARFCIRTAESGSVLDVCESSKQDGALIIIYGQNGGDNQHWKFKLVNDSDP